MMKRYEWVAQVSYTGRHYYVKVPKVYGEVLHRAQVRVVVEVVKPPRLRGRYLLR